MKKLALFFLFTCGLCIPATIAIVTLASTTGWEAEPIGDTETMILIIAGLVVAGAGLLIASIKGEPSKPASVIKCGYSRRNCDDTILQAAAKVSARKSGREHGGGNMVVIVPADAHLDFDSQINLDYIKRNPEQGIIIKRK